MNSFGVAGTGCEGTRLQGFSRCLLLRRPLPGGWREAEGRAGLGHSLGRHGEAAGETRGRGPGRPGEAVGHAGHARLQACKRSLVTGSRPVRLGCIQMQPFWPHVMDSLPDRLGNGRSVM